MPFVTRKIILQTLLKHKSLPVKDIVKEEFLGLVPDKNQLTFLLHQLSSHGFIIILNSVAGTTCNITAEGRKELQRLSNT